MSIANIDFFVDFEPEDDDLLPIVWQAGTFTINNESEKTITFPDTFTGIPAIFVYQTDGVEDYAYSVFSKGTDQFSIQFSSDENDGQFQWFAGYLVASKGETDNAWGTGIAFLAQSTIVGDHAIFFTNESLVGATEHRAAWSVPSGSHTVMPTGLTINDQTLRADFSANGLEDVTQYILLA